MTRARIGIGSNAGDARDAVERAFAALASVGTVVRRSSLYRTPPWGGVEQDDFVNAAALVDTPLSPRALLRELKRIERRLGRVPTVRWGPRAIDLDILAFGNRRIDESDLTIPHRALAGRAFALVPLAEIDRRYAAALAALPEADRAAVQRIPVAAARITQAVDWDETLERARSAAAFCASAGLVRFRLEDGDVEIDVRRGTRLVRATPPVSAGDAPAATNGAHPGTGVAAAAVDRGRTLRAEFVGIVRLSRPTVIAGSEVATDRELAYVEALGIRNPVRSGGAGRIAEVFVSDGQAVEYGQPLFSIDA